MCMNIQPVILKLCAGEAGLALVSLDEDERIPGFSVRNDEEFLGDVEGEALQEYLFVGLYLVVVFIARIHPEEGEKVRLAGERKLRQSVKTRTIVRRDVCMRVGNQQAARVYLRKIRWVKG